MEDEEGWALGPEVRDIWDVGATEAWNVSGAQILGVLALVAAQVGFILGSKEILFNVKNGFIFAY
jgi:hypothetical protein